jgi:integrating conjugative element protein (TIGR03749 family)
MRRSAYVLLLLALCAATSSQAVEILRWDRLPLAVPLIVGEERVIVLDRPVRIGLPAGLEGRLRVQSADGAVYLKANAPIKTTRLELQDLRTGELVLVDITARRAEPKQVPLEPIRILDEVASRVGDGVTEGTGGPSGPAGGESDTTLATPLAVALTRYAAQSLYAPLRTVEPLPGITSVAIPDSLPLQMLLPTLPVSATALAAWRLDGDWVTAVKLTNTSARSIDLDPRLLQGNFLAATFQHPDLGPAGRSTDTTVVYLITRGFGIAQALLPHASRFDAALDLAKPTGSQPHDVHGHIR